MSTDLSKPDRIIRFPELKQQTGLSRTTTWREIKAGRFPAPLKLTDHAVGWRQSDVDTWLASRQRAA